MKYNDFLYSWDWKIRSSNIVLRDKLHCLNCGQRGIHFVYFKYNTINDINNILTTPLLLNKMDIDFFSKIAFNNISKDINIFHTEFNHEIQTECPLIKIYSSIIEVFYNTPFHFISEKEIEPLNLKMTGKAHQHVVFELSPIKSNIVLYTLITNKEISDNNYILISPISINGIICSLAITITIKPNKILYFYGPITPSNNPLLSLEVHHLSYPNPNNPLDCDDSNLITLCHECHKKTHNINSNQFNKK